ncbi:MAG: ACP S-malonyltransferase [Deltaproteobacteria bacterium]|nr:ACP S-malonyltransferase [Deltaproteobacteria bacterium]
MGRDVYETSAAARSIFDSADETLGFEISRLCFEGPEDELRRTEIQQPALLTTSIALLRALEEAGPVRPAYVGGHSLGEYSALVACGALAFEDSVRLVNLRGRYMQEAVAEGRGAMAAVLGCAPDQVAETCQAVAAERGEVVAPANFNSPQQTVIAGEAQAVEKASERLKELGAKRVVALAVSAPFHCGLMAPAAEKLRPELDRVTFSDPNPPLVSNVEAEPNSSAGHIADLLEQQVTAPVRFTEMIDKMTALGVTRYLEVGAGRVLSGLIARIQRRSQRASLGSRDELEAASKFVSGG